MARPTGLFDVTAMRIGDLSSADFKELKENGITKVTTTGEPFKWVHTGTALKPEHLKILDAFNAILPQKIIPEDAWLQLNENCSDVLIFSFSKDSRYGIVIVEDHGVWVVEGKEYAWRGLQGLDLLPGWADDKKTLTLDSLK